MFYQSLIATLGQLYHKSPARLNHLVLIFPEPTKVNYYGYSFFESIHSMSRTTREKTIGKQ